MSFDIFESRSADPQSVFCADKPRARRAYSSYQCCVAAYNSNIEASVAEAPAHPQPEADRAFVVRS
jgi:hypothetical protein